MNHLTVKPTNWDEIEGGGKASPCINECRLNKDGTGCAACGQTLIELAE